VTPYLRCEPLESEERLFDRPDGPWRLTVRSKWRHELHVYAQPPVRSTVTASVVYGAATSDGRDGMPAANRKHQIELTWTEHRSYKKIHNRGRPTPNLGYIKSMVDAAWIVFYRDLVRMLPYEINITGLPGFRPNYMPGAGPPSKMAGSVPFSDMAGAKAWLERYFDVTDNPPLP